MVMHCHKDRVDAMDLSAVVKTFIGADDRRQKYFASLQRSLWGRNISSLLHATLVLTQMQQY